MSTRSQYSSVWSQNLVTLIFTKTTFCQPGNTKCIGHILSNSRSSRPIRTPLKHIYHASKYCINKRYHHFGSHFTEIGCIAMKKMLKMLLLDGFPRKYAQNDIAQVKLLIMTVKSLFKTPITVNLDVTKYNSV